MINKIKYNSITSEKLIEMSDSVKLPRNVVSRIALGLALKYNDILELPEKKEPSVLEIEYALIVGDQEDLIKALIAVKYTKLEVENFSFEVIMNYLIKVGVDIFYSKFQLLNGPYAFERFIMEEINNDLS